MVAFLYRMPAGIPGSVTRPNVAVTTLAGQLSIANLFASYGLPVAIESATGRLRPIIAGDVAAAVAGFLVRPYPYTGSTVLGVSVPPQAGGTADRMTHGFMSVKVTNGTPVAGSTVYARTALNAAIPTGLIGDVEASFDGSATGVAKAGNVGNGTIGAVSALPTAQLGAYVATLTAATTFNVTDPSGRVLMAGATGVAYTAEGVSFTITAGATAFAAGDAFTVTVAANVFAIPGATFTGGMDANGNSEVAYN